MARMTISQAQRVWNANRPSDFPETWPSRATIRKWITTGKVSAEKVPLGNRRDGKEMFLTLITDSAPPETQVSRRTRPAKPKAAPLPPQEVPTPGVAGFARAPRRRWPF